MYGVIISLTLQLNSLAIGSDENAAKIILVALVECLISKKLEGRSVDIPCFHRHWSLLCFLLFLGVGPGCNHKGVGKGRRDHFVRHWENILEE
ncbi:hypothetical protein CK203_004617 [Vitis vinifera]|uniref:Uncharacterized protein n=1 Tax=Vitis vinifera TaxID=29760 RepID=A0A438KG05_VITVI|nr:hypothetical protein CK203_004617 [Vitis vinifera]